MQRNSGKNLTKSDVLLLYNLYFKSKPLGEGMGQISNQPSLIKICKANDLIGMIENL